MDNDGVEGPRNSSDNVIDIHKSNQGRRRGLDDLGTGTILLPTGNKTSSSNDAPLHYLRTKWQDFPNRSDIPVRKFAHEFVLSIVPVVVVFIILCALFFGIFCTNDSAIQDRNGEYLADSVPWEGFIESFFLVLKDCVSCCNMFGSADKDLENPLISAQEKFKAKLHTTETKQEKEMRSRRESSVHRQTDSLRRLAAARDVTPRLQSPRPTSSLLILGDNQSMAASEPHIAGSINIPMANNPNDNVNPPNLVINGSSNPYSSQQFDTTSIQNRPNSQELKRRSANISYNAFQQQYFPGKNT